ncbi:MAG: HAD-IA family hydrolase [Elusimicrobia bacterium]|nr:HAD-IA family hydrolase [Elusimicrobiota bacterium]
MISAVVFDMDGVIVDSEAQWKAQEESFFRAAVPAWRAEHHERIVGLGVEDVYHFLVREFGLKMPLADYLARCEEVAREVYLHKVVVADGFRELLADLRRRKIPTAIASSSPRRWINLVMDRFALAPHFDAVVSADDVGGRTKPAPDIYLEAVRRLSRTPAECLAIEDSAVGVRAAKAAGLICAALRTSHNADQDLRLADLELAGFAGQDYPSLDARARR